MHGIGNFTPNYFSTNLYYYWDPEQYDSSQEEDGEDHRRTRRRGLNGHPDSHSGYNEDLHEVLKNKKILAKIFFNLNKIADILSSRRVCKIWNHVISPSSSSGISESPSTSTSLLSLNNVIMNNYYGLLWPKVIVIGKDLTMAQFDKNGNFNEQITTRLNLIEKYNCPHLRLFNMDLRNEDIQNFFKFHGYQLKTLELISCELSLVTFQNVFQFYCTELTTLKINPVPYNSIIYPELLHLSPPSYSLADHAELLFTNLTTLYLTSNYKKHVNCPIVGSNTEYFKYETCENQLSLHIITQLLSTAENLVNIQLYGWTIDTIQNILNVLGGNNNSSSASITIRRFKLLKQLEFYDIINAKNEFGSSTGDFTSILHQFLLRGHKYKMELQSFALTFLHGLATRTPTTIPPLSTSTVQFATTTSDLIKVLKSLLRLYAGTLIKLDLTNSPVNELVLQELTSQLRLGKLEYLNLTGTSIKSLYRYVRFMPALKQVHYNKKKDDYELMPAYDPKQDGKCNLKKISSSTSADKIHHLHHQYRKYWTDSTLKKIEDILLSDEETGITRFFERTNQNFKSYLNGMKSLRRKRNNTKWSIGLGLKNLLFSTIAGGVSTALYPIFVEKIGEKNASFALIMFVSFCIVTGKIYTISANKMIPPKIEF